MGKLGEGGIGLKTTRSCSRGQKTTIMSRRPMAKQLFQIFPPLLATPLNMLKLESKLFVYVLERWIHLWEITSTILESHLWPKLIMIKEFEPNFYLNYCLLRCLKQALKSWRKLNLLRFGSFILMVKKHLRFPMSWIQWKSCWNIETSCKKLVLLMYSRC